MRGLKSCFVFIGTSFGLGWLLKQVTGLSEEWVIFFTFWGSLFAAYRYYGEEN